jgi:hypothetical protein
VAIPDSAENQNCTTRTSKDSNRNSGHLSGEENREEYNRNDTQIGIALGTKLIESESIRPFMSERESEAAPSSSLSSEEGTPSPTARHEIYIETRIRSQMEIPKLWFLPRALSQTKHFIEPKEPEESNSQTSSSTDASSRNVNVSKDLELPPDSETGFGEQGVDAMFEEGESLPAQENNHNSLPVVVDGENNGEEIEILALAFMAQEAGAEIWDQSESTENLDSFEEDRSEDSDFEDLPLEGNDEKFVLYTMMLAQ